MCEPNSSVCTEAYGPSQHRNTKAQFNTEQTGHCKTIPRPFSTQTDGTVSFCFEVQLLVYALSAAIYLNRSRAWTYCCYLASSLGTHALAIRRSQKNSRSAGLSGCAWIQPARQLKLVVPSQPFKPILNTDGSLNPSKVRMGVCLPRRKSGY